MSIHIENCTVQNDNIGIHFHYFLALKYSYVVMAQIRLQVGLEGPSP